MAPKLSIATMCRGLLRPRARGGDNNMYCEASTFLCGRRLGRPTLVLIYEAVVDEDDVVPARAGLNPDDFMWVSAEQYLCMSEGIGEV
jgi:hypothetical protein